MYPELVQVHRNACVSLQITILLNYIFKAASYPKSIELVAATSGLISL